MDNLAKRYLKLAEAYNATAKPFHAAAIEAGNSWRLHGDAFKELADERRRYVLSMRAIEEEVLASVLGAPHPAAAIGARRKSRLEFYKELA